MTSSLIQHFDRGVRPLLRGKTRIALAWLFVILVALLSRRFPPPGAVAICFIGATIRFWASGYLRKDSRPAIGGPYAWVRNPLYLGTFLMAVAALWSIGNVALTVGGTLAFLILYWVIITDEEEKLRGIFGEPYTKYLELVPRFFPNLLLLLWLPAFLKRWTALGQVNPDPVARHYDWPLAMKNKAYEAYVSFAGIIGALWGFAWLWQRFGQT